MVMYIFIQGIQLLFSWQGFTAVCHISLKLHIMHSFRFLHGHLKEDIHMKLPGGDKKAGHCAKLNRSIYGPQKHGTKV